MYWFLSIGNNQDFEIQKIKKKLYKNNTGLLEIIQKKQIT